MRVREEILEEPANPCGTEQYRDPANGTSATRDCGIYYLVPAAEDVVKQPSRVRVYVSVHDVICKTVGCCSSDGGRAKCRERNETEHSVFAPYRPTKTRRQRRFYYSEFFSDVLFFLLLSL